MTKYDNGLHELQFTHQFTIDSPNLIFCYGDDTLNIFAHFSGMAAPNFTDILILF